MIQKAQHLFNCKVTTYSNIQITTGNTNDPDQFQTKQTRISSFFDVRLKKKEEIKENMTKNKPKNNVLIYSLSNNSGILLVM